MKLRILVVEDHAPMRAALADLLRIVYPSSDIVEAGSAARALEQAGRHAPRLVLLDVGLPDANGIDIIPQLCSQATPCSVVVVSQHSAQAYVERALLAGACAYVTKDKVQDELLPALERALHEVAQ